MEGGKDNLDILERQTGAFVSIFMTNSVCRPVRSDQLAVGTARLDSTHFRISCSCVTRCQNRPLVGNCGCKTMGLVRREVFARGGLSACLFADVLLSET